jgi:hypothetical protein
MADYPGTVEVVTFTLEEGDPGGGTITVTTRTPTGTDRTYTLGTDPELTNPTAGVYVINVPCPIGGTWRARFVATGGTREGADEFEWKIDKTSFT